MVGIFDFYTLISMAYESTGGEKDADITLA
jgi:hypothetical protein